MEVQSSFSSSINWSSGHKVMGCDAMVVWWHNTIGARRAVNGVVEEEKLLGNTWGLELGGESPPHLIPEHHKASFPIPRPFISLFMHVAGSL